MRMGGRSGGRQGRRRRLVFSGLAATAVGLTGLGTPGLVQWTSDDAFDRAVADPGPAYSTPLAPSVDDVDHNGRGDHSRSGKPGSPGRGDGRGDDKGDGKGDRKSKDEGEGSGARGSSSGPTEPTSTSATGRWGPTVDLPLAPTGVAMIPGNRLMLWSTFGAGQDGSGGDETQTAVLDLDTLTVASTTTAQSDQQLLGAGVVSLGDGRLLVAGGGDAARVSLFNPYLDAWSSGLRTTDASSDVGLALLPDGRAVAVTGSGRGDAEVWTNGHGWSDLGGADTASGDGSSPGQRWLFPTGDDQVLQMGPRSIRQVSASGDGSADPLGPLEGGMADGTAVLYDGRHVLLVGGTASDGESSAGDAWVVDISGDGPQVAPTGSPGPDRTFANSVVLPDGEVMAVGGPGDLDPEIWNPATGRWLVVAPTAVPEADRGIAVLLPDGRVFVGGGTDRGGVNGQVYTPGYLLNDDGTQRDRPEVTANPYTLNAGDTVTVSTDGPVDSFALVRMASSTSTADNDQRRVPLEILDQTQQPDGSVSYRLKVPSDDAVALPGNYLFFAVDDRGTPSRSQQVNIPGP